MRRKGRNGYRIQEWTTIEGARNEKKGARKAGSEGGRATRIPREHRGRSTKREEEWCGVIVERKKESWLMRNNAKTR